MRDFENLTEAEKIVRSLVFAIKVKDKWHKSHPTPLGEEYLQHELKEAEDFMRKSKIPQVKVDPKEYRDF